MPLRWCFLEALGQHCTRFLPMQCCPKIIKTILNRFFSCAMFSGVSWSDYHNCVFSWDLSFGKKFGHNSQGVRGRNWKSSEKKPKKQFFGLISWNFQDYIKKCMICDILPCTALLVQISKESESIWGSYGQKSSQKQPKIQLCGPTKTFEN